MSDHVAVFKRASPGSIEHTYKWMYRTCQTVLYNERRAQVSHERIDAHKPNAIDPATSALNEEQNKGKDDKGKGDEKGKGQQRMTP